MTILRATAIKQPASKTRLQPSATPPQLARVGKDRLPTNTTTRNHAIHRWYNFIAGFSPEFVSECVNALPKSRRDVLLDPFTGCGTAQLEGLRYGMEVIGYEPHPVFCRIARAKLSGSKIAERLTAISSAIEKGFLRPSDPSTLGEKPEAFLIKLFDKKTLGMLVGARDAIQKAGLDHDDLAFLILSKVLNSTSHSQTDGIYKAPTSKKRATDPAKALDDAICMVRTDLERENFFTSQKLKTSIYAKSCEFMTEVVSESVDIIVTSPPYLNNFDFAEMTRMHLYFWSIANNWGEITDRVRSKLIVNTTTALRGHKDRQMEYRSALPPSLHEEADTYVSLLRTARGQKAGKKEYDFLVYPYFAQMSSSLRESLRTMRVGAYFHMMVADAALYGIHIPTPQIIAHLMDHIGFRSIHLDQVRARGERWILDKRDGSRTGLGEYHISAVK